MTELQWDLDLRFNQLWPLIHVSLALAEVDFIRLDDDLLQPIATMDNQFNSEEWSLPVASAMMELEKYNLTGAFTRSMHNMGVPIQPVNLAINASSRHHPTEDPEVQEVYRSQVSNNKGKKKVAQRGKSFTKEEDRAICSAFLHVSTDPIVGEPKWHEKMAESNTSQKVNQKHSLNDSEIEINSMHTNSAIPERPEGRDNAKKRCRVMADTSSSSTAVEMLQKMHERGEKNDEKEDQLRQEMFQMERERLELQKLNWEKKWAIMESNAKLRQNEYELNQWNADLLVMSQDLDKLAPPLRAMYEQKQMEIMKRRGINTPSAS
ncbi:hypothetical protein ZEAMMB73_Zm00001d010279 [Zea mays]|uniref:Uncharacterized protein n=1 Tax=Zea mays TaxID=4577 RepID=A0A1D6FQ71_MAIZE|nr:hypothetical protein ZEAMMB73_Zm00001d010279 [Zea mays]